MDRAMPGDVAGVILAGGASRRMGGVDKTGLDLGGKPMLHHAIDRLSSQVDQVIINSNSGIDKWQSRDLLVVADCYPDRRGPLAGVLAGLDWAGDNGYRNIVTVAGDTPFFPVDLVDRLLGSAVDGGMAIAATMTDRGLRRHPTFGLWPTALRADLREAIEGGTRKVVCWADRFTPQTVVFEGNGLDPFYNVNTPEDLARAAEICRGMVS